MTRKILDEKINISNMINLPLEKNSQKKAREENIPSVHEGKLKLYNYKENNVKRLTSIF